MTFLRVLARRLLSPFRRNRWESDLDDELQFHLQMETEHHVAQGLAPRDARRAALKHFGGVDVTKDSYRDQHGLPWLETLARDVRFGLRLLGRHKGFTAVAVLTLALGIGANTAIFSVVNGVLLKPLPFDGSDRIVTVWENFTAQGGPVQEWIEVPNFYEWQKATDLFETMVAYTFGSMILTDAGEPQRLTAGVVSSGFFATFATAPAMGRDFSPADDAPGAAPVTILGDGFWQRALGADPAVIGTTLQLNGVPTIVIGVLPPGFAMPGAPVADLWTPLRLDPATATRDNFFLQGLARLKPGVTVAQATDRLDAMMAEIGAEFPSNRGVTIQLVPLLDQLVAPVRVALYVLLGVVAFVLLIACANIANLMLSRSATRAREMAIRVAMGAGRSRIVRQLLTESLVLSLAGAALGVLLAYWGTTALVSRAPASAAPRLDAVSIDSTVLLFTLGISLAAGLVSGLAPVLEAGRRDVHSTLKEGGRGSQNGAGGHRLRAALAAGQIALALCLLIASGLAVRSFAALMDVDPGFCADGLTTAFVSMPPDTYAGGPELVAFMDELVSRVGTHPIVESAAAVSVLPLAGSDSDTGFEIEGRPPSGDPGSTPVVWFRRVTPSYFETMGLTVTSGREFTSEDRAGAPGVVMVSDVAAARFWPGEDALGKRLRFGPGSDWHTMVGITRGVRHSGLAQEPRPELYFPFAQRPGRTMTLVVRSEAPESAVADLLRADLREVSPTLPLSSVTSMASLVDSSVAQPRFFMSLTAAFGTLALVLAAVGLYGVMSYNVSRQTTEMGLRMALGASRGAVLGMVVSAGLRLAIVGVALGLATAFWASTLLAEVLFEVEPRDALTFGSAAGVLIATALLACLVPALRATRIDPISALRVD